MNDVVKSSDTLPGLPPWVDLDEVLELAITGQPIQKIIKAMGLSLNAYDKLLNTYPLLKEQITRARNEGYHSLADSMLTLLEDNPEQSPHALRIKFESTKWYLSCRVPQVYGEKIFMQTEDINLRDAMLEAKKRAQAIDVTPIPSIPDPFE